MRTTANHVHREFVELAFLTAGIEGVWIGQKGTIEEVFVEKQSKTLLVKINPTYFRPAEVDVLLGDSTQARNDLGWVPQTSFFGLVKKMVDNDLKNNA